MKLHIVTVGNPKLAYAKTGLADYCERLRHYHRVRVTHLPDRHSDTEHILAAAGDSYKVGLVIEGQQFSSTELAAFLEKQALAGRELSFLIGGAHGLPANVINKLDLSWSLGKLTLPHDMAVVVAAEALYRASTINANHPYHK